MAREKIPVKVKEREPCKKLRSIAGARRSQYANVRGFDGYVKRDQVSFLSKLYQKITLDNEEKRRIRAEKDQFYTHSRIRERE